MNVLSNRSSSLEAAFAGKPQVPWVRALWKPAIGALTLGLSSPLLWLKDKEVVLKPPSGVPGFLPGLTGSRAVPGRLRLWPGAEIVILGESSCSPKQ